MEHASGYGTGYDNFKREAGISYFQTEWKERRYGFSPVPSSQGETAYLLEHEHFYLAQTSEEAGTKPLVAHDVEEMMGKGAPAVYSLIAKDTFRAIINDLAAVGAAPLNIQMILGVGDSDFFEDEKRRADILQGWAEEARAHGCMTGGGQTSVLQDVMAPYAASFGGSALGVIIPKSRRLTGANIQEGDAILLVESSGIGANGLTYVRRLAEGKRTFLNMLSRASLRDIRLRKYRRPISCGRTFGEALLAPAHNYFPVIKECQDKGVRLRFAAPITGGAYMKIMRANKPFAYVLRRIFEPQEVFRIIQKESGLTDTEMYARFSVGAGLALIVDSDHSAFAEQVIRACGFSVLRAGEVLAGESLGEKKVVIEPLNIEYKERCGIYPASP